MDSSIPPHIQRVCPICHQPFLAKRYKVIAGLDRFCSSQCRWKGFDSPEDRFWRNVRKQSGCWTWTKPGHPYGRIHAYGTTWAAHRLSWFIHNGPIPDGKLVCHTCDNPPCVRPDHLFLGDSKANHEDCVKKNRQVFGERNGRHKLTEAQALEVKRLYASGIIQTELAKRFGVTQIAISKLVTGCNWKYLNHL